MQDRLIKAFRKNPPSDKNEKMWHDSLERVLWTEFQIEKRLEAEAEREKLIDEDGAIVFEGEGAEDRVFRLPPDVPIPSREMVRRHRAAGHCPYRSWCSHCVSCAANAPGHSARPPPVDDTPEVHGNYAFFRDRKRDRKNTVTVLVVKDRIRRRLEHVWSRRREQAMALQSNNLSGKYANLGTEDL